MNAYEWWVFEFGCRTDVPLALLREKIRLLNLLVCELILMRLHFHGVGAKCFMLASTSLNFFFGWLCDQRQTLMLDACVIVYVMSNFNAYKLFHLD